MGNNEKSRRVVMRLKNPLYEFLYEYAQYTKRTLTDVIRIAIEDYYQRLFLGKLTPSTKRLRQQFLAKFGTKKQILEHLKKKPVKLIPIE